MSPQGKPRRADAGPVGPDRPVVIHLPARFPLDIVAEMVLAGVYISVDLCSGFSRFLLQKLGAFTRALGQGLACICSRLGSIKNAEGRTNSESYQKPTETTSAVVLSFV